MKTKIAILHRIISPYRIPLFEKLSENPLFDIKIFADVKSMSHRSFWSEETQYNFHCEFLKAKKINLPWKIKRRDLRYSWDNFSLIPLHLPIYLSNYRPDIVISTELGARTLLALLYVKTFGKKILVWSDEYLPGMIKHSMLRQALRRTIVKTIDGFCSCGQENKKYLEFLGADETRINNVSIAIDNEFFARNATNEAGERIRRDLKLKGTVFLNVGQFISRKGLDKLLECWNSLPHEISDNTTLLLLGSGNDEDKLKKIVDDYSLRNVVFVPAKSLSELPAYYAASDIFIFPTLEDGWGLVVNEAMACGKPILCSRHAGCCQELMIEGSNGFSFDPLNREDTVNVITKISRLSTQQLYAMGDTSRKIVSYYNYERMVKGFEEAILCCIRN